MNKAFNDFLSGVGEGLAGAGGPNMKNYTHATKLYVEGSYARAPKFNHLYFVAFNFNEKVIRDPSWLKSGVREVGLLVKSFSLPRFKIKTEEMNQYNRKTQVQTKITYDPVTLEFHDDNSEITNGLWKNYYRYYYTDSIYGGKDDVAQVKPSQISLGEKLFGGIFKPGSKRTATQQLTKFPEAFTNNKYGEKTYPYGLDNNQSLPFFKSIDVFILHQQKFTQMTLINPKITSWDHDEVSQSDSSKVMKNKMTVVYESVLYNDGRIGKGSDSGVFAEAFYDTEPSPLSISGLGAASLLGQGGLIAGFEDIFGADGSVAQGNYLSAILQAATLSKNYDKQSPEQRGAEGYSMLATGLRIAASSREISSDLASYYSNGGFGIYTNQFSKNNLEEIPTAPVVLLPPVLAPVPATGLPPGTGYGSANDLAQFPTVLPTGALASPVEGAKADSLQEIQTEIASLITFKNNLNSQKVTADQYYAQIDASTPTAYQIADGDYIRGSNFYIFAIQQGKSPDDAFALAEQDAKARLEEGNNALKFVQGVQTTIASNIAKIDKTSSKLNDLSLDINTNSNLYTAEYIQNNREFGAAVYGIQGDVTINAVMLEIIKSQKLGEILINSAHIKDQITANREQQTIFNNDLNGAVSSYNSIENETKKHWAAVNEDKKYPVTDRLEEVYWKYSGNNFLNSDSSKDKKIATIASVMNITSEQATVEYDKIIAQGQENYFAELNKFKNKISDLSSKINNLHSDNSDNIANKTESNMKIGTSTIVIGAPIKNSASSQNIAPSNPDSSGVITTGDTTVVPSVAPAVTGNPTISPTANTVDQLKAEIEAIKARQSAAKDAVAASTAQLANLQANADALKAQPTVTEATVTKMVERAANTTAWGGELTPEEMAFVIDPKKSIPEISMGDLAKESTKLLAAYDAAYKQGKEIQKLADAKIKQLEAAENSNNKTKIAQFKAETDALQNALTSVIEYQNNINAQLQKNTNIRNSFNDQGQTSAPVTKTSAAVTYDPINNETNVIITEGKPPDYKPSAKEVAQRTAGQAALEAQIAQNNAKLDGQAITIFKYFQKTNPSIKTPEDAVRYIQQWNNTPGNFPIPINPGVIRHILKIKINK